MRASRVNQVAVPADCTVQITPFAVDLHVGFVGVPGTARLPFASTAQLRRDEWSKPALPFTYRIDRIGLS